MPYGTVKVDNVTFTNNSVDATTTFSGIYASITNNLTLSGTATAATFTGTTANFTNVNAQNINVTTSLSGLAITGGTAGFTTITGTTVTGTTANFATLSGTTVTGTTARFITITGGTAGFTTITGTTVTGTTANFVTVSGLTVTGTTASFTSGIFTSLSGTTHTITSGVFALGTAALPSISFVSDPNTGIYSPGADQVAVATNGTGRLFVDASGNVGVGITPSIFTVGKAIEIGHVGNALFGATSGQLNLMQNAYYNADFKYANTAAASYYQQLTGEHIWHTASSGTAGNTISFSERLRITAAGLVGVGTSSPGTAKLAVTDSPTNISALISIETVGGVGGISGTAQYGLKSRVQQANNNTYAYGIYSETYDQIGLGTTAGYFQTVTAGTNAGVNNTAIRAIGLHPGGGSLANAHGLWASASGTGSATTYGYTYGALIQNTAICNASIGLQVEQSSGATYCIPFRVLVDSTEHFRVTDLGKVGIGTTSPGSALEINAAAATSPFIAKINTSEAARIDSSGRLLVGTSTSQQTYGAKLEIVDSRQANAIHAIAMHNDNIDPLMTFSRGSSLVSDGNSLGTISFRGHDGTDKDSDAASIAAQVDGTPGANDMPGRIVLSTTADGAASPTEAMRINSQQELLVGTTTRNANGGVLQLKSGITFPATAVAASDANTLDDYEEGTWTPTQGTGVTVVGAFSSIGNYTKIGKTVIYAGYIVGATSIAFNPAGGNLVNGGLPFSVLSGLGCGIAAASNTTSIIAYGSGTGLEGSASIGAVGVIYFSGSYLV